VAKHGELAILLTEGERDDRASLLIEGPAREVAPRDVEPRAMTAYAAKYGERPASADCWLVIRPLRVLSHHPDAGPASSPSRPGGSTAPN
jgi:hypothetical protein